MSEFTKALVVSPLADGSTWVLTEPFSFYVGTKAQGEKIDVPIGFVTDFTSVPTILRWYVNSWGRHGNAAVVHDWLYWRQNVVGEGYVGYSRARADQIFLDAMVVLRVRPIKRKLIYRAVRIAGGIAWWRAQQDRVSGYSPILEQSTGKYDQFAGRPSLWSHIKRQLCAKP